jgi:hypothetical protein
MPIRMYERSGPEVQAVIDFTMKQKNSMAYYKAVELRTRLSGLLIERVETVNVDVTGALKAAKARTTRRIVDPSGNQDPAGSA